MKKTLMIPYLLSAVFLAAVSSAQQAAFPVKWEEMTTPEFISAVEKSEATCLIPIGVLEKHGPHLPLGTDMLSIREIAVRAARKEYSIVFPHYYFGQIHEARHQPGTMAYSPELLWKMLQETCDELGRNGIRKIILVNGHGGNNSFLPYFCQSQLAGKRDYSVIIFQPEHDPETAEKIRKLRETTTDGHAGETETSEMLVLHPGITHPERGNEQSGADLNRLELPYGYTAIWWYAKFPNHYAGDGSKANRELGNLLINSDVDQLAKLIKAVKTDDTVHKLQQQFYKQSEQPLETKQ
ncbi:creatininase family protein [Candidatus Omnitrophota bacterium]